jgi:hypothetical protein
MTLSRRTCLALLATSLLLPAAACKSYWINADVQNQTGITVHELEVTYPSASFGANSVAPGAVFHYRFQVRNSGLMKVDYLTPDGKTVHADGTSLDESMQGVITIRLLPAGKVEFNPQIARNH